MAYRFRLSATQGFLATATGNAWLATEPFCVSVWIYVDATSTGVVPLTCVGFSGTATTTYRLVGIDINTNAAIAESRTATNVRTASSPSTVRPGWNHIWAQFVANNSRRVQLNGDAGSTNANVNDPGQLEHIGIGILPTTPNIMGHNGTIGEIAIWKDYPLVTPANEQTKTIGKALAGGTNPLQLNHLRNKLVFYRSFDDALFDRGRAGSYRIANNDRKLTLLNGPTQTLKTPFRYARRTRWPTWWIRLLNFIVAGTTNVTLTAAASAAAVFIRQVGLNKVTTSIGIAGTIMQVGKGLATGAVGSAVRVLQVGKTLAAAAVGTASISFSKVFMVTLSAAANAIASITLQVGKIVSAAASGSAARILSVGKGLSAAASGAATFTRQQGLALTATTVAVAGNVMQVGKTLTANVTGAVSLVKSFVVSITLSAAALVMAALTSAFSAAPTTPNLSKQPGHAGGLGWIKSGRWTNRSPTWISRSSTWRRRR